MQIQREGLENLFEDLWQTLELTKLDQNPSKLMRDQLLELLQIQSEKNLEKIPK